MSIHLEGEVAKFTVVRGGEAGSIPAELPPLHMCKCGRGPWRKGQRNCALCNREGNRKYRLSLKKPMPYNQRAR